MCAVFSSAEIGCGGVKFDQEYLSVAIVDMGKVLISLVSEASLPSRLKAGYFYYLFNIIMTSIGHTIIFCVILNNMREELKVIMNT